VGGEVGRRGGTGEQAIENAVLWRALEQAIESPHRRGVVAPVPLRVDGDNHTASDGIVRRADDAVITRDGRHWLIEDQLGPGLFARQEGIAVEEAEARLGFGGGAEDGDARVVGEGMREHGRGRRRTSRRAPA